MAADLREHLQSTLGAVYSIERELGGGGMSRVFVATERALGRRVVVKVLPPELTEGLSTERFRREVLLAAQLQHPSIVPVLAAGAADGLPYYTMPFVEGQSLRQRLERSPIPVGEALEVLRDVASALDYAHAHSVVHRDIKPDNILASGGRAMVADFGIARALRRATQGANLETLTQTGFTVGTPAYMSPEQVLGDRELDARSDVYSLACVAYEMLAGTPPFAHLSGLVTARRFTEPPPSLSTSRRELSGDVDVVVRRALALDPAERFATAGEFARALEAALPSHSALGGRRSLSRRRVLAASAALLAVLTTVAVVAGVLRRPRTSTLDPHVIAVLPFRVSGADRSSGYLREGMLDLLATKLTGVGGFRAVDSRSLLSVWRRAGGTAERDLTQAEALALARRLGAGRLLQGEVVGTSERLVISATLLATPGGNGRMETSVHGPPDSLPALVDRLAATLLSLGAGEGEHRLAGLTSTSLPALRTYLEGRALNRRARFQDAVVRYETGLQIDSTFALAALGVLQSAGWGATADVERAARIAWRHRERLAPRDRAHLEARLGLRYPAPATIPELFAAAERAAALAPDDPASWHHIGDQLYHFGAHLEMDDAHPRALAAFTRALALDSTVPALLEHKLVLEGKLGDTASLRRTTALLSALDTASDMLDFNGWYSATILDDSARLRALRARFNAVSRLSALHVGLTATDVGVGLEDADEIIQQIRVKSLTATEQGAANVEAHFYFLNRGRPAQARRFVIPLGPDTPWAGAAAVLDALFWDGDTATAERAELELAHSVEAPTPPDIAHRIEQAWSRFAVAQYRLGQGEAATARRISVILRGFSARPESSWKAAGPMRLAMLLDAQLAALDRRADAPLLLSRLDSSLRDAPALAPAEVYADAVGNLVAARLWEQRGDLRRALAAARRWRFGYQLLHRPCLSTHLREEGRLAALLGDRTGAIRAYRHYLALRADPELPLRAETERVRAELTRLERITPVGG